MIKERIADKSSRSQLLSKVAGLIGTIVFSSVIILKRDGYFPLPKEASLWLLIIQDLFLLAVLIFGVLIVVKIPLLKLWERCSQVINKYPRLFLAVLYVLLITGSVCLIWFSSTPYSAIYKLNPILLFILTCLALFLAIFPLFNKDPYKIIAGLVLATIIIYSIPIFSIPLTAKLGDLMPIVIKQGQAFLSGQNIYQYYLLDNGVLTQAVRQPGIMLLFLPSVMFHFDPRILSLFYQVGGGLIIIELVYPGLRHIKFDLNFILTIAILAIYLLLPYRVLRSDLYDPPYWCLMLLSLWALFRKRYLLWAIVTGISIFTQIWSWIMFPFMIVYLLRQHLGFKRVGRYIFICLGIGLTILALFIIPNPQAYFEHVFGYYAQSTAASQYPTMTIFLTPLVFALGLGNRLQLIQFLGCAIVGVVALWKLRDLRKLLIFLIIVTMVFIQFNIISWDYMYLTVLYLLIFYIFANESN